MERFSCEARSAIHCGVDTDWGQAEAIVLLNFFDVETATGERSVELHMGDLPTLGLDVDLLVVSAFEGDYTPVPRTLLGRLYQVYGLLLSDLPIDLDLRRSPLKSWVSAPLDLTPSTGTQTRFRRLAVIEGAVTFEPGNLLPWPPFNRLFSLLAPLPSRGEATLPQAIRRIGSSASSENSRLKGGQGSRSPGSNVIAPSITARRRKRHCTAPDSGKSRGALSQLLRGLLRRSRAISRSRSRKP